MTTTLEGASDYRVTVEPAAGNGLRERSQIMADKPTTVKAERVSRVIGRLTSRDMARLQIILAAVLGFAD
jgi:mRNA interferase MazF